MKKTWKPIAAAAMMLAAGTPYCIASTRWFTTPGVFPRDLGGGQIWPWLGLLVLFPFACPLLTAAICAILRRAWGLAFLGAVAPLAFTLLLSPFGWFRIGPEYVVRSLPLFVRNSFITLVYLLMLVAAVLIYLARSEFKGRRSSTEHLFSPPKNFVKPAE